MPYTKQKTKDEKLGNTKSWKNTFPIVEPHFNKHRGENAVFIKEQLHKNKLVRTLSVTLLKRGQNYASKDACPICHHKIIPGKKQSGQEETLPLKILTTVLNGVLFPSAGKTCTCRQMWPAWASTRVHHVHIEDSHTTVGPDQRSLDKPDLLTHYLQGKLFYPKGSPLPKTYFNISAYFSIYAQNVKCLKQVSCLHVVPHSKKGVCHILLFSGVKSWNFQVQNFTPLRSKYNSCGKKISKQA